MSAIGRDEVLRIARLAKLDLDEAEIDKMVKELRAILAHVDRMGALDVSAVEPMAHAVAMAAPRRADAPAECLAREAALSGAPKSEAGQFAVPRILEE